MNKTLSKVIASAMVAVTLMTAAPVTASAANANNTTTSTSTSASASTSTYKTMYAIKSVYSYKKVNGKLVKSTAVYKGTALKVKSSTSKYYILSDGRYIKKTAVGAKRINWTDIKYSKPLTRYISKDNTKARAGALTSSKVKTTLDKGTQVTIVARTTSGFYKLSDGSYILQTSTTKTKPASTQGTTTNSRYPNDKYGPGENGYANIILPSDDMPDEYNPYGTDDIWGDTIYVNGYVFIDCDGNPHKSIRDEFQIAMLKNDNYDGLFADGTAVAGKDIPYGWYTITSSFGFNNVKNPDRIAYVTVKQNGKEIEHIVPQYLPNAFTGFMFYVPKGATVEADAVVIAPAPNGVFEGKTSASIHCMYERNATVQAALVSNDGYGIKPGTYTVTKEDLEKVTKGQYVYVIHDYFNMTRHDRTKCGKDCLVATFEDLADHGEFVWWTKENAEFGYDSMIDYRYVWDSGTFYCCNGVLAEYHCDSPSDWMSLASKNAKDSQPKTITVSEGDLVLTMAAKIELK